MLSCAHLSIQLFPLVFVCSHPQSQTDRKRDALRQHPKTLISPISPDITRTRYFDPHHLQIHTPLPLLSDLALLNPLTQNPMAADDLILVDRDPAGIGFITINRPKSLNSLTRPMIEDLARAIKTLDQDDSIGVIIISGRGRAFCSGVDLTAAESVFKGNVRDPEIDPVVQMDRCRKPIIGGIGGFAVTAGFEISLACDILVAGKDAKFIDTHARFGIFPSWGLSQKLARIIGPNRAREVSLTSMAITAEMAEKWGLVNHVVETGDVLKKAREVAEAILRNQRDMVFRYKSVINDGFKLDLIHALALEKERGHSYYVGMTADQFANMHKFISGRSSKPVSKM